MCYQISRSWAQRLPRVAMLAMALTASHTSGVLLWSAVAVAQTPSSPPVASYPVPGVDVDELAQTLRKRYADHGDVKVIADRRMQRIVAQAPEEIQRELAAELQTLERETSDGAVSESERLTVPAAGDAADSDLSWAPTPVQPVVDRLQHLSWRELAAALQGLSGNELQMQPAGNGRGLVTTLPSRRGSVSMEVNPQTGEYRLQGSPQLTSAWLSAIRVLDQPARAERSQIVPVKTGKAVTINRALEVLREAQNLQTPAAPRWSADVIGIAPPARRRAGDQLAQAQGVDTDVAPPPPAEPGAPGEGGEGDVGVEGSLIAPVQIEYVEGLDAIIIRGRKADVDRVMKIIDEIEQMSVDTEPAIELIELEHVNSQSMADLVSQVNGQAVTLRLGAVSITALIKPNALILIGRKEGVDATLELVKRLDKPVAPTSQFNIFRLKHVPATDAAQTITTFYANRTGLGPRILVQADFRTNSLIVYASPRDMAEVQQLLNEIDVTESVATSEVRVFKLNNALAEELAPILEATLRGQSTTDGNQQGGGGQGAQQGTNVSGKSSTLTMTTIDTVGNQILKSGILTEVRVAADVRANSLLVTAPAESMELIAALVKQLDELPTSEAQIKVFTIVNGDAAALTQMLDELFGQQQQQQGGQQGQPFQSAIGAGDSTLVPLRFSTDLRTNSIIATGSMADLGVVEAILLRLDESEASQRKNFVYRLMNAPAQDVANAVNQFLQTERQITLDLAPDRVSPFEQIEREVVVVPELVSNTLIISATPRYFDEIRKLVEDLDARPPMVLIQVLIGQITLNNAQELGVELGIQDSLLFDRSVFANNIAVPGFNFNNQPLGNSSSATSLATRENVGGQAVSHFGVGRNNSTLGYGGLVLSASSESVNVLIRALQESRRLDVLSRPQVMTLNNQPAFVLVGQRVPFITGVNQTQFGVTNTTTLQNVGLLLGVTPRISPDGLVVMEIDAEKSELGPTEEGIPISINQNGDVIKSPIINTTTAQTTVSARSGQTVILGGLITKSRSTVTRQVPYLSSIPVLGNLFRFDGVNEERTELLIIMTPYIVNKVEDSEWLNQVEGQRMSWCLADVVDLHGEAGLLGSGLTEDKLPTQVIYPDRNPSVDGQLIPESADDVPAPPLPNDGPGALPDDVELPSPDDTQWSPEDGAVNDYRTSQTRRPAPQVGVNGRRSGRTSPPSDRELDAPLDEELPTRVVSPVQYLSDRQLPDERERNTQRRSTVTR